MQTKEELAAQIIQIAHDKQRCIVAVAGPPASGKSTLAEALAQLINTRQGKTISAVVPMDGFHLDNATLDQRGLRQRKGAPETFDAAGFVALVSRLKTANKAVDIPLFDRTQDAVIPAAQTVSPSQQILLVEGNYLLLDSEPWSQLQGFFDFTIFINPGIDVLEQRLIQRWLNHGYDQASAKQRALSNDIPNARFVLEHSATANCSMA